VGDEDEFEVEEFAFIGRTFEEYRPMFDLDEATLREETILDCPSGPGSFVALAHERGASVTGVDVMYEHPPEELARRCRADYEHAADQLSEKRDLFTWEFYGGVEDRARVLREAYETFLADYPEGRREGRYLYAGLPRLPFADDSFSVVLSAHFLFLYGDRLGYDFHVGTLRELARVASEEVRVFPLVGLDTEPYERLDEVRSELTDQGLSNRVREAPFEFQQGATAGVRAVGR
jgi:hypothetical protein